MSNLIIFKPLILKLRIIIGIDKDILWILINKVFSIFKTPITIFFLLKYLTPEEQGLWYTFISLGALSIFAELGFTTIITQFVSHEFAHLVEQDGLLKGNKVNLERIISLIRFSIKFYLIIIPSAILLLCIIGFFYFKMKWDNIYLAWVCYSIIGGFTLLSSLFQAIYQGLDKVKNTQKNILIGSVLMTFANWIFLFFHFNIWALILGNLLGLVLMFILLYYIASSFWRQIFEFKLDEKYSWFNEIIHLQWKYAISWASGFFIFYLYVPSVYKFEGAIMAGKVGITMAIISSLNAVSYAWVFSKIPKFNIMAANKQKEELLYLFNKSFMKSVFLFFLLNFLLIIALLIMNHFKFYETRVLPIGISSILILSQFPSFIAGLLSVYLRSHKVEPYYILSVVNALLTIGCIFIVLPNYNFNTLVYSLTILNYTIILPYSIIIYNKYKNNIFPQIFYK